MDGNEGSFGRSSVWFSGSVSESVVDLIVLVDGTIVDIFVCFSSGSRIGGSDDCSSVWPIRIASGSRIVGTDVVGISEIWLDTGWKLDISGAGGGVVVVVVVVEVNNRASGRSGDPASATSGSTPGIVLAIAVSGRTSSGAPSVLFVVSSTDTGSVLFLIPNRHYIISRSSLSHA